MVCYWRITILICNVIASDSRAITTSRPTGQQLMSREKVRHRGLIRMYGAVTSQNLWSRYDRHFVGKTWHNVRNRGAKIYRVIQMSTESFSFKKMFTWSLIYQRSAYLSNITVTKISQRFTHKMAAKNGGHRHETKLHSLSRYVYQYRHRHYRSWHKSKVIFFTYTDPRRLGLHVRYSLNAWKKVLKASAFHLIWAAAGLCFWIVRPTVRA